MCGGPFIGTPMVLRDASLSASYRADRCFSSVVFAVAFQSFLFFSPSLPWRRQRLSLMPARAALKFSCRRSAKAWAFSWRLSWASLPVVSWLFVYIISYKQIYTNSLYYLFILFVCVMLISNVNLQLKRQLGVLACCVVLISNVHL